MHSLSCVYWIHLPEHTDIFSQGYVGVSVTGAKARYVGHKCAAKGNSQLPIHKAIRKYGELLIVDTVIQGSPEYCYSMEGKLRPTPKLGYNISAGGESTNLGSKHSDEAKAKMSKAQKGRIVSGDALENMRIAAKNRVFNHTEETKAYLSSVFKGRPANLAAIQKAADANRAKHAWDNPASNVAVWLQAEDISRYMKSNPTHGTRRISTVFDASYSQLAVMYKKIKSGWNPLEDEQWLIFSSKLTPEVSGNKSL